MENLGKVAVATGAIVGTIIEGIGSKSGGGRSGRGGRKTCHRKPDGRIQCGSN